MVRAVLANWKVKQLARWIRRTYGPVMRKWVSWEIILKHSTFQKHLYVSRFAIFGCCLVTVYLAIPFRVTSLALGQYNCPSASEVTLANVKNGYQEFINEAPFYVIYCTSVTYDIYGVAANKCDMFADKIRLDATLDHITHQVEDSSWGEMEMLC